jgi:hypothetical protein
MKSFLSTSLVLAILSNGFLATQSHASQASTLNATCAKTFAESVTAQAADNAFSYCSEAKNAMHTANGEKVKLALNSAVAIAAGVLAAMNVVPATIAVNNVACTYMSLGAIAVDIGSDVLVGNANKDVASALSSSMMTLTPSLMGFAMGSSTLAFSASSTAAKAAAASAAKTTESASGQTVTKGHATGCITTAVTSGITAAISGLSLSGANSSFKAAIQNAQNVISTPSNTIYSGGSAALVPAGSNVSAAMSAGTPGAVEDCDTKSGTAYLTCAAPETQALTANPDFMNTMQSALGQNPGDFAKNLQGDTPAEAGQAAAAAMGASANGQSAAGEALSAVAKTAGDAGILDKYTPMTYAHADRSIASASPDMDFGKLMSGMLKNLNPDAAKNEKNGNAADLVFRQLDLLPADKVESNKQISLFARIGYRYRKNMSNVDQLNWSQPQNQASAK